MTLLQILYALLNLNRRIIFFNSVKDKTLWIGIQGVKRVTTENGITFEEIG